MIRTKKRKCAPRKYKYKQLIFGLSTSAFTAGMWNGTGQRVVYMKRKFAPFGGFTPCINIVVVLDIVAAPVYFSHRLRIYFSLKHFPFIYREKIRRYQLRQQNSTHRAHGEHHGGSIIQKIFLVARILCVYIFNI